MIYINITSTFTTKRKTGIQRVVANLGAEMKGKEFVFITWDFKQQGFKKLIKFDSFFDAIYNDNVKLDDFLFSSFQPGDYFFDIDAAWSDSIDRNMLYPSLKSAGVYIVNLHYDSVPIVNARWSHENTVIRYSDFFYAKIAYSDYIFSISQFVKDEIDNFSEKFLGLKKAGSVIPLGPLPGVDFSHLTEDVSFEKFINKKFFISVGTIEPRKNYDLLIDTFEKSGIENACLVIVGREGWNVDNLIAKLKASSLYNKKIFWLNDVEDDALAFLYSKCLAYITCSHYEGYGLPAVEALSLGIPTIVSNGGALPEVVGESAEIFSLNNPQQLIDFMNELIINDDYVKKLKAKAAAFTIPSWKEVGNVVKSKFAEMQSSSDRLDFEAPVTQLVYITIDIDNFTKSINSVLQNMGFIKSVVVLTHASLKGKFVQLLQNTKLNYKVFCDEEILSPEEVHIKDHGTRNSRLRQKLYLRDEIETNFIASDDDYLAIRNISPSYFQKDGRHNCYYFYNELGSWAGAFPKKTSFDVSLVKTGLFLERLGYPVKAYSSHMPQIINKNLANEIYSRFLTDDRNSGMAEWCIYFNIAAFYYPDKFLIKKYETLSWPGNSTDWVVDVVPDNITFQNYYSSEENGINWIVQKDDNHSQSYLKSLESMRANELSENIRPIFLRMQNDKAVFNSEKYIVKSGKENVRRILIKASQQIRSVEMEILSTEEKDFIKFNFDMEDCIWVPFYPPAKKGTYNLKITLHSDKKNFMAHTNLHVI